MRFVDDGNSWSISNRLPGWQGNTGAAGAALPDGVLLAASSDVKARKFRLWGYTPEQGDFTATVDFSDVQLENAMPTGRIDTMGDPCVVVHSGVVKLLVVLWGGDNGGVPALGRVRTSVRLVPDARPAGLLSISEAGLLSRLTRCKHGLAS